MHLSALLLLVCATAFVTAAPVDKSVVSVASQPELKPEQLPVDGASLVREKRQFGGGGRRNNGFRGRPNAGGFGGPGFGGPGFGGPGFGAPSFGSSAANAQAQAFNAGNFGASHAGTQTQGFQVGPNGITGGFGQSVAQNYDIGGYKINVAASDTLSFNNNQASRGGSNAVTITGPNGQRIPFNG
ncbi:Hypothetical predicted protein [Cloeon dipterum]|uniref:Uncharacterized protein n=1 Tax=Cloeon dipterum TaxID=197152 RepID=A0A8S1E9T9_9INSE|nr:Hypothetical predicted protein [Cloeon dipterum]